MEPKHSAVINIKWPEEHVPISTNIWATVLSAALTPVLTELADGNDVDVNIKVEQSYISAKVTLTVNVASE